MKWKNAIICIIMAGLLMFLFTGCIDPIEASGAKATGGGWIPSVAGQGSRATFGFTMRVTGVEPINEDEYIYSAKGQIQLVDHGADLKYHASVWGTYRYGENSGDCVFTGTTRDGMEVSVMVTGNVVYFHVADGNGSVTYENFGEIMGGNIKVE